MERAPTLRKMTKRMEELVNWWTIKNLTGNLDYFANKQCELAQSVVFTKNIKTVFEFGLLELHQSYLLGCRFDILGV